MTLKQHCREPQTLKMILKCFLDEWFKVCNLFIYLLYISSKYNDKRIHYKNKLSRARGVYLRETGWRDEKIKELEKEIFILRKQEEKVTWQTNKIFKICMWLLNDDICFSSDVTHDDDGHVGKWESASEEQRSSFTAPQLWRGTEKCFGYSFLYAN